jgi:hypothetical protein
MDAFSSSQNQKKETGENLVQALAGPQTRQITGTQTTGPDIAAADVLLLTQS